jgi:hypothetical protein
MHIGDIVLHETVRWLVTSYDKMTRTVMLTAASGAKKEVPAEMDMHTPDLLKVVCNPGKQWNVLAVKTKNNAGPFVKAVAPSPVPGHPLTLRERVMEPWVDWISSDPFREGGSVFIRPGFGLKTGDLVIFTHRTGAQTRMTVPAKFGTVEALKAAKSPIKKPEVNRFTHILDEDYDD